MFDKELKWVREEFVGGKKANKVFLFSTSTKIDRKGTGKSKRKSNKQVKSEITGDCLICLEKLDETFERLNICGHLFHKSCIQQWFQSNCKQSCPTCGLIYGRKKGPQPENGQMIIKYVDQALPGFENDQDYDDVGKKTIEIIYSIPSGIQREGHPHPGQHYSGTRRQAYLPNNQQGKTILTLLQLAFQDQQIFTIGRSMTTGAENVVTWNDIHHKTQMFGGVQCFAYPDATYLLRVRQELADKGYQ